MLEKVLIFFHQSSMFFIINPESKVIYFGAFILEHVIEIMADICNNNYTNISSPPLSHLHVLKEKCLYF